MPIFEESNLRFKFDEDYDLIKSDGNINFEKVKQYLQGTKDTDFLGFYQDRKVFLMEVKNFRGVQPENIEELTNEVAQKLRDTVAIIAGASRNSTNETAFWQKLHKQIGKNEIEIFYVFWLEEDVIVGNRQKKPRLSIISQKLKEKCKWLTTKISVQSIENYNLTGLQVTFMPTT